MKIRIMASMLAIALVAALIGGATMAWFTDSKSVGGNVFTSGTLTIDVSSGADHTINLGTITNWQPGDRSDVATIRIENTGSLPVATFGRFVITNDNGLAEKIDFYNYKVRFYDAAGNERVWFNGNPSTAPEGYVRRDDFIVDGSSILGYKNILAWVNGHGPQDIMGTAWDFEGLAKDWYFEIEFQLEFNTSAGLVHQGRTLTLGYEVLATQVNSDAIIDIELAGVPASTITSSVYADLLKHLKTGY